MNTRTNIAFLIAMMVNAVIFGAGVVAVMTIPAMRENAHIWLPAVVVASFAISPIVSWYLAPRLRSRWVRSQSAREAGEAGQ